MSARRHRLAQRRKTVGFSQERLAEVVGVDRSTVVRWERAETEPQPWHRPRLAAALKLSVEELAALLADVGEAPSRPNERLDYVLRHPGHVDFVTIAYLREQVQCLDEQYDQVPSTMLLAETGQLHGQAMFLRGHATAGRVQRELAAAIAESAILMGQLVWDASQRRDHAASNAYFDQAVSAARYTRDVVTEAHAVLRKSYVALYGSGNPSAGHRAPPTARSAGNGQMSMGDRRVLGNIVCAGQTACGRRRPAVSGTCVAARRFRTPCDSGRASTSDMKADDAGYGCSVGARAPRSGGHQMDGSGCDLWTGQHRRDWRRPARPVRTEHRNLLTCGPWDW
jgi:transcriptional regulator with XRE-family HTH domain